MWKAQNIGVIHFILIVLLQKQQIIVRLLLFLPDLARSITTTYILISINHALEHVLQNPSD